jgi:hypothetical protein
VSRKAKPVPFMLDAPPRGSWEFLGPEGRAPRPAIRFNLDAPAPEADAIRVAHAAIKTARHPARRRGDMEADGAAALAAAPRAHAKRPWTVRFYYLSMGDETLAADFHGYTEAEAAELAERHRGSVRVWRADGKIPEPEVRAGYRLVLFPSEYLAVVPDAGGPA